MKSRIPWRAAAAAMCLLLLALAAGGISIWRQGAVYIGVPVMNEREYARLTYEQAWDLSEEFYLNGKRAAVDEETAVIYIPQVNTSSAHALEGMLELQMLFKKLRFAPDPAWEDLDKAVRENHAFTLLVTDWLGCTYAKYAVVFTPHPVLRLHSDEEQGTGTMTLFDPKKEETGQPWADNSLAQWHVRGGVTKMLGKKSQKIRLCDRDGKNKNLNLLGLGNDDDWILNSLATDDTKLREVFAICAYEMMASKEDRLAMTEGRYVEVVIDGEYSGLYFLCRRIDRKYLLLDADQDLLFKGNSGWNPARIEDAYQIVHSPYADSADAYALIQPFFENQDVSMIDVDSWIDVCLLLQMGAMSDNLGYKNMYYALCEKDGAYVMKLIPWDTDMSFGMSWMEEEMQMKYMPEVTVEKTTLRAEYALVKACVPELDARMSERWQALRRTVWTKENLLAALDTLHAQLNASGALIRDGGRFGLYSEGEDTYEGLREFISRRLTYLDTVYSK